MGSVNLHFKLRKENSMGLRPAARPGGPSQGDAVSKEGYVFGSTHKDHVISPQNHGVPGVP